MRANEDIRTYAKQNGIKLYMIADVMSMKPSNFTVLLRHELSQDRKKYIFALINDLKNGASTNE